MEELLKQQYQREEKTRLKNKQAERLLIHGLESKKGIRALHEYRLQIVNRQQKELTRELERIRADLPERKHRKASKESTSISKESKRPSPRQSRSHWSSNTHARQTRANSQSTTANSSPTRRSSQIVLDDNDDDDDDDDDDSDDYDDDGDYTDSKAIPDRDVLKAIMKSMVSDWERRASRAVEQHRRQSIAQLNEVPKSPEFYDSSNTSVLTGNKQSSYGGKKVSKWKGGGGGNSQDKKPTKQRQNSLSNQSEKINKNDEGYDFTDRGRMKQGGRNRNSNRSDDKTNSVEMRVARWRNQGGGGESGGGVGGRQGRILVDKEGAHFLNEETSPMVASSGGQVHNSGGYRGSQTFRMETSTSRSKPKRTEDYSNVINTKSAAAGPGILLTSGKTGLTIDLGGQHTSPYGDSGGGGLQKSTHSTVNGKHSHGTSGQVDTFGITSTGNVYGNTAVFRSRNDNTNNSLKNTNGLNAFSSGRSTREENNIHHNAQYNSRFDFNSNSNNNNNFLLSETPITARSTRSLPVIKDRNSMVASSPRYSSSSRNPPPLSPVSSPLDVSTNLLSSHSKTPRNNVFSKHPKVHIYKGKNRSDSIGGGGVKGMTNKKLRGRIIMKTKDTRNMFGGKSAPVGSNGSSGDGLYNKTVLSPLDTNSQGQGSSGESRSKRYNRNSQLDDDMSRNR